MPITTIATILNGANTINNLGRTFGLWGGQERNTVDPFVSSFNRNAGNIANAMVGMNLDNLAFTLDDANKQRAANWLKRVNYNSNYGLGKVPAGQYAGSALYQEILDHPSPANIYELAMAELKPQFVDRVMGSGGRTPEEAQTIMEEKFNRIHDAELKRRGEEYFKMAGLGFDPSVLASLKTPSLAGMTAAHRMGSPFGTGVSSQMSKNQTPFNIKPLLDTAWAGAKEYAAWKAGQEPTASGYGMGYNEDTTPYDMFSGDGTDLMSSDWNYDANFADMAPALDLSTIDPASALGFF